MKIRFLETYSVKAAGGPTYSEGEVYDLPRPTAEHFLRKRRAEIVQGAILGSVADAPEISTPDSLPPEVGAAVEEAGSRTLGGKKDPVKAFSTAQRAYRKKKLSE